MNAVWVEFNHIVFNFVVNLQFFKDSKNNCQCIAITYFETIIMNIKYHKSFSCIDSWTIFLVVLLLYHLALLLLFSVLHGICWFGIALESNLLLFNGVFNNISLSRQSLFVKCSEQIWPTLWFTLDFPHALIPNCLRSGSFGNLKNYVRIILLPAFTVFNNTIMNFYKKQNIDNVNFISLTKKNLQRLYFLPNLLIF